jgi:hypothetical protein
MIVKKGIVLLGAVCALSANAGVYQCEKGDVSVPCEARAWDFGAEALYLRNDSSIFSTLNIVNPNINNYVADLGWGFRLEGSYHFSKGNDITINWAYFDNDTRGVNDGGSDYQPGDLLKITSAFNIVNLEFAQHIMVREQLDVRLHAGFQYADIKESILAAAAEPLVLQDSEKADGFGPRIGVSGDFALTNGFSVFAKGALALMRFKQSVFGTGNGPLPQGGARSYSTNVSTDMSLGLKYTRVLAQGDLSANVAWDNRSYDNLGAGLTDIGWDGLSFGLKWVGNA